MRARPALTRRRALLGAGILTLAPFVASCGTGSSPVGRIGFTLSAPQPGLQDFERDVRRVRKLGAGWVRFGVVGHQVLRSWSDQGKVVFDPDRLSAYDEAFDLVDSLGLGVCLLTVDGAPAAGNTDEYFETMDQYWSTLSERFGSRTSVWQVYNEVSDTDFRSAAAITGDFDEYLSDLDEALGVARESIHRHSPDVKITTSASGYPVNDEREADWLRFFSGVRKNLDMSTINLYPVVSDEAISSLPERLRRLEDSAGLPVSVGEFGLQTGPELYTEDQQVESLTKSIDAFSRTRADPVFVYRLRNDGAHNDDGFGLYEIDGSPKSSVPKVAAAIADHYPNG